MLSCPRTTLYKAFLWRVPLTQRDPATGTFLRPSVMMNSSSTLASPAGATGHYSSYTGGREYNTTDKKPSVTHRVFPLPPWPVAVRRSVPWGGRRGGRWHCAPIWSRLPSGPELECLWARPHWRCRRYLGGKKQQTLELKSSSRSSGNYIWLISNNLHSTLNWYQCPAPSNIAIGADWLDEKWMVLHINILLEEDGGREVSGPVLLNPDELKASNTDWLTYEKRVSRSTD